MKILNTLIRRQTLFKNKQIFNAVMTFLRVDRLSNHVVTQQKLLEQTLTVLSNRETIT